MKVLISVDYESISGIANMQEAWMREVVTGDDVVCADLKALLGDVETVVVKRRTGFMGVTEVSFILTAAQWIWPGERRISRFRSRFMCERELWMRIGGDEQ